jgi:hypothetical protein
MSVAIEHGRELFEGGPPRRLQRSLGLIEPDDPRTARRAKLAVLVGWAPLAVLVIVEEVIMRSNAAKSFFYGFAESARFPVALPLLILAGADCTPQLGEQSGGLITTPERERLAAATTSTQQLLDSKLSEMIVPGLRRSAAGYAAQRDFGEFGEASAVRMFDEFFGIEIETMPGNPARKRSWDEEQSLSVTIRWLVPNC